MVFLKDFFEEKKKNRKKNPLRQKCMQNYPACKELRLDPFQNGAKTILTELPHMKVYLFPIKGVKMKINVLLFFLFVAWIYPTPPGRTTRTGFSCQSTVETQGITKCCHKCKYIQSVLVIGNTFSTVRFLVC